MGNIAKSDTLTEFTNGVLTVGLTAVEVKVGASRYPDRKVLRIYNDSTVTMYYGAANTVTTSGATKGWPLEARQWEYISADENMAVWVICGTAGQPALIQEWR